MSNQLYILINGLSRTSIYNFTDAIRNVKRTNSRWWAVYENLSDCTSASEDSKRDNQLGNLVKSLNYSWAIRVLDLRCKLYIGTRRARWAKYTVSTVLITGTETSHMYIRCGLAAVKGQVPYTWLIPANRSPTSLEATWTSRQFLNYVSEMMLLGNNILNEGFSCPWICCLEGR